MRFLLAFVLLLSFAVPPAVAADVPCEGVMCSFSHTGPGRPPAVEDVYDPDFEMIYGPEPSGPPAGGRWSMRHKAAIVQWQEARRRFKGLVDVDLPPATEGQVMQESGGVVLAYETNSGRVYLAIVGGPVTLTRFSLRVFQKVAAPAVAQAVVNSILHRGGCFNPLAARHARALGAKNKRNCGT